MKPRLPAYLGRVALILVSALLIHAALPSRVFAAVAVDAVTTASTKNVSSLSWSHTVSGANRLLVVSVSMAKTAGVTVTGITYSGTALSLIGLADNTCCTPGQPRLEMWKLVAPATSINTVVVTLSGANNTIIGTAVSNNASPSVTVTSAAGELVQDATAWESTATQFKAADKLCLLQSGTGNVSGVVTYVSRP